MLSDDLLPSNPGAGCEEEAAMLLCQLFSVSQFSSTVEEILLEEFAAKVNLFNPLIFYLSHFSSYSQY